MPEWRNWLFWRPWMLRVKRTKRATDDRTGIAYGDAKVAYATGVDVRGAILGWSADAGKAVPMTDAAAERVKKFYKGRANVGELGFESVRATTAAAVAASAADLAVEADAAKLLQDEVKRLESQNDALEMEKFKAQDDARKLAAQVEPLKARIAELEAANVDLGQRIAVAEDVKAQAAKRIGELESNLAEKQKTKK